MDILHGMSILLGILIWIGCAFLAHAVADSKGHNGVLWFCLTVILSPLALIAISMIPKNEDVMNNQATSRGEMKKCPYCAKLIKSEAIKCRYCGEEQPEIIEEVSESIDEDEYNMMEYLSYDKAYLSLESIMAQLSLGILIVAYIVFLNANESTRYIWEIKWKISFLLIWISLGILIVAYKIKKRRI